MATIHPTPRDVEVRQMLAMLFGNDLTISEAEELPVSVESKNAAALYVADDGTPVTACVCEINFAAFAGSALTKIPPGGAEDAASSGELTENMMGNLNEVMNICSRLFMSGSSPHLRLDKMYASIAELPENAKTMLDTVSGRLDLKVSIPGYGEGYLAFLAT
jgi:hypothetical protein